MKELSIEEKATAYDEALNLMKDCIPDENGLVHVRPDEIFPELKKSEGERIRAFLYHTFTKQYLASDKLGKWHGESVTNILAWLEKQGEQKFADKVKPKFHEGEWITIKE